MRKYRTILEPHPLTVAIGGVLLAIGLWGLLSAITPMVVTPRSMLDITHIECRSAFSPSMADAHGQGFRQDVYAASMGRPMEYEALYLQVCDDRVQSARLKFGAATGLGALLVTWYVVRRRRFLEDEKKRSDEPT